MTAEEFYKEIRDRFTGRVVSGKLEPVLTREELEEMYKEFCERD